LLVCGALTFIREKQVCQDKPSELFVLRMNGIQISVAMAFYRQKNGILQTNGKE
jgi:hypothetical protein